MSPKLKLKGAPAFQPSLAFPYTIDSLNLLVKRHQLDVSLLSEPRMLHLVSPPLQ